MATLMRSLRQVPFLQPLTDEQLINWWRRASGRQ